MLFQGMGGQWYSGPAHGISSFYHGEGHTAAQLCLLPPGLMRYEPRDFNAMGGLCGGKTLFYACVQQLPC